jgi:plasmid stabilization system protein ParE
VNFRVVVQPRAEQDLLDVADFLLDRSKSSTIALRWLRGIRAKINRLKTSPHRCPVDPDSAAYGTEVRVLLYGKRQGVYRVLFTIRSDTVFILTVRHSAQRRIADEIDQGDEEEPSH